MKSVQNKRQHLFFLLLMVAGSALSFPRVAGAVTDMTLTASPQYMALGVTQTTLDWSFTGLPTGSFSYSYVVSCTLTGAGRAWNWSQNYPTVSDYSFQVVPRPSQNTTYSLACSSNGGTTGQPFSVTRTVRVYVKPELTLAASPTVIDWPSQSSTLSWQLGGLLSGTSTCTASGGGWSGSKPISGTETVSPSSQRTYTLSCNNSAGTASASVTVYVVPRIALTASPSSISPGMGSLLTWSTSEAASCTASGGWSGAKALSGSEAVYPTTQTVYTLTCTGSGGSAVKSVTVMVPPAVSLTADFAAVILGRSSRLTWSATNATGCTASGDWSGAKALSGSETVVPASLGTKRYYLACTGNGSTTTQSVDVRAFRPNFLIVLTDDQRYDTFNHNVSAYMPQTHAFFQQGVWFDHGYVTTPLCCPSRSSILTGMYAKDHGVVTNELWDDLTQTTVTQRLRNTGYYTMLVGKYLNSWNESDGAPAGFDKWLAIEGGIDEDSGLGYFDYDLVFGSLGVIASRERHTNYQTTELGNRARNFLSSAPPNQPFFMLFAVSAPHSPNEPAPGDGALYGSLPLHRPLSFNEADKSDKPSWLQAITLDATEISKSDAFRLGQLRMLAEADRQVAATLAHVQALGKLEDTFVIFLSDNGFFWGEHGLQGKRRIYEESSRVPFAVYFPNLHIAPRVESRLVANIDIAPTLYQLAGLPIPAEVSGKSLLPLLEGTTEWRDAIWIEQAGGRDMLGQTSPAYEAVHTSRFVYVEYKDGDKSELYDLTGGPLTPGGPNFPADPYQLYNKINDANYAAVRSDLQSRLPNRCHVLTAAFGDAYHPVIQSLWAAHRRLVGNQWNAPWHRAYLDWYDQVGPKIAARVKDKPWLKVGIRWLAQQFTLRFAQKEFL